MPRTYSITIDWENEDRLIIRGAEAEFILLAEEWRENEIGYVLDLLDHAFWQGCAAGGAEFARCVAAGGVPAQPSSSKP